MSADDRLTGSGRDVFRDADKAARLVGAFVQLGREDALAVLVDFERDPAFLRAAIVSAHDALGIQEQAPSGAQERHQA